MAEITASGLLKTMNEKLDRCWQIKGVKANRAVCVMCFFFLSYRSLSGVVMASADQNLLELFSHQLLIGGLLQSHSDTLIQEALRRVLSISV